MAQKDDMVNSIFQTLFGEKWDEMFIGEANFFGSLFEHINNYAVTLIVIITLFTIFGGLMRAGQKREFLGQGRTVSFWVLRLVLFVGCCFPALNGYSIAQGLLLKAGVRYSADLGNTIAEQAFQTMANDGMLPLGEVFFKPDRTLMYRSFENAVCYSYMHHILDKKKGKFADPYPLFWINTKVYGNSIAALEKQSAIVKAALQARENTNNVGIAGYRDEKWGVRWGGKIASRYPEQVCGEVVFICNYENINTEGLKKSGYTIQSESNQLTINLPGIKAEPTKDETLEEDIERHSRQFCTDHGIILTNKMMRLQTLANNLVTGGTVRRGQLDLLQIEYETEVSAKAEQLNSVLKTAIQEKIGKSKIYKEVSKNGFIMLGFHYYQTSKMIDEARALVEFKPRFYAPDYDKIDPNFEEGKGLKSYFLMAESYRNSDSEECITSDNKIDTTNINCNFETNHEKYEVSPDREDNYVMRMLGKDMNNKTFSVFFNKMDPDKPVSSIMDLGSNMLNTGSTIIGAFVALDIIVHGGAESILGKAVDFVTGKATFIKRLLVHIGKGVMLFSSFMITCGIFLLFVVPTIPLVTWIFAIFAWIIIVFETMIAIPFWAVASSTATGDGFVADTGRTGLTLFLNVIIRPILLPILFFGAIVLAVIFCQIIMAGLDIFLKGQVDHADPWIGGFTWFFAWGWKMFITTYLFVMAFKLSHEIMAKTYDFVMRFVNSSGRAEYGTDAPNSDMMAKGMAGAALGTKAAGELVKPGSNNPPPPSNNGDDDGGGGGGASKGGRDNPPAEHIRTGQDKID